MDREQLSRQLQEDEGFRGHVYQDSEGYWTIGFGRMVDEQLGGGITREEAAVLLDNDVDKTIAELDVAFPWWQDLPDAAQRGLCNMAFNLGLPRLLGFQNMLAALEAGDCARAADEALDSHWAEQVGARATRIAELYRSCGLIV